MDMLSYLISLVKTSKEVGIPGIGTIYKKKSPGRYDVQTHSFLPPSYTLAFSEELAESYSLTEFVARKRNISVAAATYFVEQFAEEINKQLNEQHEANLGTLGTLHNHSGALTFSAGSAEELGFEYYGLPAIKDEVWSAAEPSQQVPVEQVTEEQITEEQVTVEEVSKEQTSQEQTSQEQITGEQTPGTEQLELENSNADVTDGHSAEDVEQPTVVVASTVSEASVAEKSNADPAQSEITQTDKTEIDQKITDETPASETVNNEAVNDESMKDQPMNEDLPDEEEAVYEEITELGLPEKIALIIPLPEIETPEGVEHIEDHAHLHVANLHQQDRPRPTVNETLAQAAATTPVVNELYQPTSDEAPRPVLDEPAGPTETAEIPPVYYHLEEEAPEKTGMPWYLKVIIVFLVIAIAAAATYIVKPELFENLLYKNETEQPQLSNQALQKTADSIATADSIKQSIAAAMLADSVKRDSIPASGATPTAAQKGTGTDQKTIEQKAAEQKAVKKTITAPTTAAEPEVIPAGTTFEVIGSSLSSQKEADRFLAQMKKAGIKAKAFPGKKVIRISIATFKDDKSARAAIPALKEKLGISGLYVYTNKPE